MESICNILFNRGLLLALSIALLLIAYIFSSLLLLFLRRIFNQNSLILKLISKVRLPVIFFFLEIALLISIEILKLPKNWEMGLHHLVTIMFIATVGWGLIKLAMGFESYLGEKSDKRTFVTRAKFFYRILIFLIAVFTFASILMTFPAIRSFGIGILGSAGIMGIALGIAARPMLLNLMAGFQIAFTEMLKIGDLVMIDKESGVVEEIFLTHVILKTSDLRRLLFPISYFIDKPFENWDRISTELIAYVYLYCDYTISIESVREQFKQILMKSSLWDGKKWAVEMTNWDAETIELRLSVSAHNAPQAFDLKCYIREEMLKFLQNEPIHAFPRQRYVNIESP